MTPQQLKISPSLLAADFLTLGADMMAAEAAGADTFHLDIMDAHLAPNLSYGPPVIAAMRRATTLPLDAHLMIDNPWLYIDDYINLKVDSILIHAEAYGREPVDTESIKTTARFTTDMNEAAIVRDLKKIQAHGIEAGVTINIKTPISVIEPILAQCDSVLLMSVDPGFGGQKFMPAVCDKIQQLRAIYDKDIKVDGGVSDKTAPDVVAAGANVLIAGSYLFGSDDYADAIRRLRNT